MESEQRKTHLYGRRLSKDLFGKFSIGVTLQQTGPKYV